MIYLSTNSILTIAGDLGLSSSTLTLLVNSPHQLGAAGDMARPEALAELVGSA